MSNRPSIEKKRAERRARQQAARRADERRRLLRWLGAAVLAALVVAGGLIFLSRGDESAAVAIAEPLLAAIPSAGRVLGDPAAPVTLVEWGDYQ